MKIATIIVRVLLGLMFLAAGIMFFVMTMPPAPPGLAGEFMDAITKSHYMHAVKIFEIAGGVLLIIGRYVPLGLTLLGPVIVNILFDGIFLDSKALVPGIVLTALELFLVWRYRAAFAGILTK